MKLILGLARICWANEASYNGKSHGLFSIFAAHPYLAPGAYFSRCYETARNKLHQPIVRLIGYSPLRPCLAPGSVIAHCKTLPRTNFAGQKRGLFDIPRLPRLAPGIALAAIPILELVQRRPRCKRRNRARFTQSRNLDGPRRIQTFGRISLP